MMTSLSARNPAKWSLSIFLRPVRFLCCFWVYHRPCDERLAGRPDRRGPSLRGPAGREERVAGAPGAAAGRFVHWRVGCDAVAPPAAADRERRVVGWLVPRVSVRPASARGAGRLFRMLVRDAPRGGLPLGWAGAFVIGGGVTKVRSPGAISASSG